ncbi:tRNA lysidine(34) synthetase TilS [Undibacterium sp. TJN25]|uniref:tRNA lysidine(34) synthetase TilS n=1 Tax=Undibacterium sp. TJN25 TaxID=3413056 RepID=UPI003BF2E1D7
MKSHTAGLQQQFDTRLEFILSSCSGQGCLPDAQVREGTSRAQTHQSIAVAYSGGLDSSVLLQLAREFCTSRGIDLFAFHVHHGISPNAGSWLLHCKAQAMHAGIPFDSALIQVDSASGEGVEASARSGRYRALGDMCRARSIPLLLTAHHQDDQAETLLLQLLRGSGVAGLSGMDLYNKAPQLLGTDAVAIARPLLEQSRQALQEFATAREIPFVEDESNADSKYARNALRLQVMPILAAISPGFTERIARSARHARSAHRMLLELAQQDVHACTVDGGLDINKMQGFSDDRIDNLLRFWLSETGVRMPTTARLAEMRKQLFAARDDARITVTHDGTGIHRYENRIYASRHLPTDVQPPAPVHFQWAGEDELHFPGFGGKLHFERADVGLDSEWLRQQSLTLCLREGGERLRLGLNRPSRDIKSHYQTLRIPFWQRLRLPFVAIGSELLFAAGVGLHAEHCTDSASDAIQLRWEADTA